MFIRINLISEEVNLERIQFLKKRIFVLYGMIWVITLFIFWINYSEKNSNMHSHIREIKALEKKIDEIIPQYSRSVKQFQKHKRHEVNLSSIYKKSVDTKFILKGLQSIASTMPQNFWTDELRLITLDYKEFDDNQKGKKKQIKVFEIKGKLFFETGNKKARHVEEFVNKLKKKRPFANAKSKVDLANIKVGKNKANYFHDFYVGFGWEEPYLF